MTKPEIFQPFCFPAYAYVRRLRLVLQNSDIQIVDDDASKKYSASLISRLPLDMISLLPENAGFATLLNFIESWDRPQTTTSSVMNEVRSDVRPSYQFGEMKRRLKEVVKNVADDWPGSRCAKNSVEN